jgi:hypothetical protein
MSEHNDTHVQHLCIRIIYVLDEYMEARNGRSDTEKLAVSLNALTRVLSTVAASVGIPVELIHAALKLEMESAHETMMSDEVKH